MLESSSESGNASQVCKHWNVCVVCVLCVYVLDGCAQRKLAQHHCVFVSVCYVYGILDVTVQCELAAYHC